MRQHGSAPARRVPSQSAVGGVSEDRARGPRVVEQRRIGSASREQGKRVQAPLEFLRGGWPREGVVDTLDDLGAAQRGEQGETPGIVADLVERARDESVLELEECEKRQEFCLADREEF